MHKSGKQLKEIFWENLKDDLIILGLFAVIAVVVAAIIGIVVLAFWLFSVAPGPTWLKVVIGILVFIGIFLLCIYYEAKDEYENPRKKTFGRSPEM